MAKEVFSLFSLPRGAAARHLRGATARWESGSRHAQRQHRLDGHRHLAVWLGCRGFELGFVLVMVFWVRASKTDHASTVPVTGEGGGEGGHGGE